MHMKSKVLELPNLNPVPDLFLDHLRYAMWPELKYEL